MLDALGGMQVCLCALSGGANDDVTDLLKDLRPVVVVTNCERLTRDSAAHLQWLHRRTVNRWPMILIGNQAAHRAVGRDDLLASSITHMLACEPFEQKELIEAVRGMHERVAFTEQDLLVAIDRTVCRGSLTYWSLFIQNLEDVLDLAGSQDSNGVLNVETAKQAYARMPSFAVYRKLRP